MDNSVGFIILRHVNSYLTNKYWKHCYNCIRKHFPDNKIIIIDDNSNLTYLSNDFIMKNTRVINSEYSNRGELLPYIYYLQNREFETAVIIHDSVFINKKIDTSIDKYKFLWNFKGDNDRIDDASHKLRDCYNDEDLINMIVTKILVIIKIKNLMNLSHRTRNHENANKIHTKYL